MSHLSYFTHVSVPKLIWDYMLGLIKDETFPWIHFVRLVNVLFTYCIVIALFLLLKHSPSNCCSP